MQCDHQQDTFGNNYIRDGVSTNTIPNDPSSSEVNPTYGRHESYEYPLPLYRVYAFGLNVKGITNSALRDREIWVSSLPISLLLLKLSNEQQPYSQDR